MGKNFSVFCCLLGFSLIPRIGLADLVIPESVLQAQEQRIQVMSGCAPTVVAIFASSGEGGGSGVLIEPNGLAITNYHVVEGLGGFMKAGLNDGKLYDAVVVGIDKTGDVALIQLLGRDDFPTAVIGDSDELEPGDMVFAMGNPFLLASDFKPTVTYGMVSGTHRYQEPANTFLEYTDCIQVDASINPGNSGGPLFNSAGQLVGINGRISVEKRGRVNVGAGYSISINQVINFLDHLKSGRLVDHATLGALVTGVADGSVVVSGILENSSAYRRGLRWGDEILSFSGRPIRSVNQYKNILGIYPKDWIVPLSFRREGRRHDIDVRLSGLHTRAELLEIENNNQDQQQPPQENPDEKKPDDPHGMIAEQAITIPEQYKHLYVEREGFANYYFNELAQQRLLKTIQNWGNFSEQPPVWVFTGQFKGSAPAEIRLLPDAVAARLGTNFAAQNLKEDPQDVPAKSGGLLTAFEHLRQFLSDREGYFTEFYYLGSEPFSGTAGLVDVLVSTRGEVVCRWYFERTNGACLGFDTFLLEDADPCEIRFGDLKKFGSVSLPGVFKIHYGGEHFGDLQLDSLQFLNSEGATQ